jgi:hypothetical protein
MRVTFGFRNTCRSGWAMNGNTVGHTRPISALDCATAAKQRAFDAFVLQPAVERTGRQARGGLDK